MGHAMACILRIPGQPGVAHSAHSESRHVPPVHPKCCLRRVSISAFTYEQTSTSGLQKATSGCRHHHHQHHHRDGMTRDTHTDGSEADINRGCLYPARRAPSETGGIRQRHPNEAIVTMTRSQHSTKQLIAPLESDPRTHKPVHHTYHDAR